MLPTLVEVPPEDGDWIHEVKYDGYRTQLVIENGQCRAFTRRGHDWTEKYPTLVQAGHALPCRAAIIDGEAIATTPEGKSDYATFLTALKRQPGRIALVAFDLLHLDGQDLRDRPLIERRAMLWELVKPADGAIQYSPHVEISGKDFYRAVDNMGLEGMVSKRAGSIYRSGRTEAWLKTKCYDEADYEIAAILREPGRPAVAYMIDKDRKYVGGAFITLNHKLRERLWERVQGAAPSPAPQGMKMKPEAQWVRPGLVGRVRFLKGEETLRHATLREIREDG